MRWRQLLELSELITGCVLSAALRNMQPNLWLQKLLWVTQTARLFRGTVTQKMRISASHPARGYVMNWRRLCT